MEIVKLTTPQDNQIFQQTDGYADIPVSGVFLPEAEDPTAVPGGYPG